MEKSFFPSLSDHLYADEDACMNAVLKSLNWSSARSGSVSKKAEELICDLRQKSGQSQGRSGGELESFMQHYALDTEEGLALMTLAEALLRIPDAGTANALIHDKVVAANWLDAQGTSKDWVVKAAGLGLMMTSKTLDSVLSRMSRPIIRAAMVKAMRIMGGQFVLGDSIETAMQNAQKYETPKNGMGGDRMSYDMLGEGARTPIDAEHYFQNYKVALEYLAARIGRYDGDKASLRPGMSVKLSALHPRYEMAQSTMCLPVVIERVKILARLARDGDIAMTIDAEEAARLDLSLHVIMAILSDPEFAGWDGFGLAVQAYQKRAIPLIDAVIKQAETRGRNIQMRLVKGAYWDTEVKHAQVNGFEDYPVWTRKSSTDVSYLACAQKMLESDCVYPMFGTHNAHSVAGVLALAKAAKRKFSDFEFQRLHGMGDALYGTAKARHGKTSDPLRVSVYAPVGPAADLLPYLVRRLLENGANSSFVNKVYDEDVPAAVLAADPVKTIRGYLKERGTVRHPDIALPADIFPGRKNSLGLDLDDHASITQLYDDLNSVKSRFKAEPLTSAKLKGTQDSYSHALSPIDKLRKVGRVRMADYMADHDDLDRVFKAAGVGFKTWNTTPVTDRATALERYADLLEKNRTMLIHLCVHEAGKTLNDARDEIREAVDFCRYYALQARSQFKTQVLAGPTGEYNALSLQGRGVFVCISPWNFPLAIFTGQIVAALAAGNAVISKPAEQAPLIAHFAVKLMHKAGIPESALHLLPGDGRLGAALASHRDVAGVAFTGSTEVAQEINKTLAGKMNAPIVPLIAETGGQNAMIVDSSALPEQVVDDVILSAFGSAGQRCSALRILYVQDDVADKIMRMLQGAMAEIIVGDPLQLSNDIGPVIDADAHAMLKRHRTKLDSIGQKIAEAKMPVGLNDDGYYFAPCAYELPDTKGLEREVFGPVLHVIRYAAKDLDDVIAEINAGGYGLTLGIHSRIESVQHHIAQAVNAGNVYINRGQIGAVVESQPFGGMGLSGTGPKAGGPHYLHRFATEKAISVDITAAGGNTALVNLDD